MKRSKRALTVLAAFALLLTGFFSVAAAASPADAPAQPGKAAVGYQSEQARPDQARKDGAGTLAAISYRHLWCGVKGDFRLNLTGLGAYDGQPVAVTIAEAGTGNSEFIGSARMRVNNVSVWAGKSPRG